VALVSLYPALVGTKNEKEVRKRPMCLRLFRYSHGSAHLKYKVSTVEMLCGSTIINPHSGMEG
jgi:hypothetical protein